MRLSASLLALVLLLAVALSCNLAERLGGNDESVMVTSLWPDVPPFPGATKTDNPAAIADAYYFRQGDEGQSFLHHFSYG